MIIVIIWIQAGFATVVISAAMKGVPDDLVEAAKIDGATDRQAFFKIVLPYVKGTIITVATTTVIAVLKIFDIVQTMGKGGSFEHQHPRQRDVRARASHRTTRATAPRSRSCSVPRRGPDRVRQRPQPTAP